MFYLMMQLYPYISYLSTMFYYFFLCFLSDSCCWGYIKSIFFVRALLLGLYQIHAGKIPAKSDLEGILSGPGQIETHICLPETAVEPKKRNFPITSKFGIDPSRGETPGRQPSRPHPAVNAPGRQSSRPTRGETPGQATSRPTRGNVSAGGIWLRELAYTTNPPAGILPEGLLCII